MHLPYLESGAFNSYKLPVVDFKSCDVCTESLCGQQLQWLQELECLTQRILRPLQLLGDELVLGGRVQLLLVGLPLGFVVQLLAGRLLLCLLLLLLCLSFRLLLLISQFFQLGRVNVFWNREEDIL